MQRSQRWFKNEEIKFKIRNKKLNETGNKKVDAGKKKIEINLSKYINRPRASSNVCKEVLQACQIGFN